MGARICSQNALKKIGLWIKSVDKISEAFQVPNRIINVRDLRWQTPEPIDEARLDPKEIVFFDFQCDLSFLVTGFFSVQRITFTGLLLRVGST